MLLAWVFCGWVYSCVLCALLTQLETVTLEVQQNTGALQSATSEMNEKRRTLQSLEVELDRLRKQVIKTHWGPLDVRKEECFKTLRWQFRDFTANNTAWVYEWNEGNVALPEVSLEEAWLCFMGSVSSQGSVPRCNLLLLFWMNEAY